MASGQEKNEKHKTHRDQASVRYAKDLACTEPFWGKSQEPAEPTDLLRQTLGESDVAG
jgi:hypothetical protein